MLDVSYSLIELATNTAGALSSSLSEAERLGYNSHGQAKQEACRTVYTHLFS